MHATATIGEQAKPRTLADLPEGVMARVRYREGITSEIRWRSGDHVLYETPSGTIGAFGCPQPTEYMVEEVIGTFTANFFGIDGAWQVVASITPWPQPKKQTLADLENGILATVCLDDGTLCKRYRFGDYVIGPADVGGCLEVKAGPGMNEIRPCHYKVDVVHGMFGVDFHE